MNQRITMSLAYLVLPEFVFAFLIGFGRRRCLEKEFCGPFTVCQGEGRGVDMTCGQCERRRKII